MDQEFDGKGLTPYDPAHNSTYLLAGETFDIWIYNWFCSNKMFFSLDGELYTATVSDFSGSDPLIYKEPLRTEQYDSKILNSKFWNFFLQIIFKIRNYSITKNPLCERQENWMVYLSFKLLTIIFNPTQVVWNFCFLQSGVFHSRLSIAN